MCFGKIFAIALNINVYGTLGSRYLHLNFSCLCGNMMLTHLAVVGDTEKILNKDGDGRACPGVTEAGVVLFVLAPCLDAGGCSVADHIVPRVLTLACDEVVDVFIFTELAESAKEEIGHINTADHTLSHKVSCNALLISLGHEAVEGS